MRMQTETLLEHHKDSQTFMKKVVAGSLIFPIDKVRITDVLSKREDVFFCFHCCITTGRISIVCLRKSEKTF